jgi:hypothetical protein
MAEKTPRVPPAWRYRIYGERGKEVAISEPIYPTEKAAWTAGEKYRKSQAPKNKRWRTVTSQE